MADTEEAPGANPKNEFTDAALEKLSEVVEGHGGRVAGLRLEIVSRQQGAFQHVLSLVEEGSQSLSDQVQEVQGITLFVDSGSADYLDGVKINYEYRGEQASGLEYDNPNPLWRDEREFKIQELFDDQINPAIASHGGWVSLKGVEGNTAFVQLGGGCQGCGMADVTLKQGIEASILQEVEGIEKVADQTDHDGGTNPYYKPSKK